MGVSMGLLERKGPPESRYSILNASRLLVTIPTALAVVLLMIFGYAYLVWGGDWSRKPTRAEMVVVLVIPIVGLTIGSCLGSLIWGYLGKKLLGFTREEVEPFVHPPLPIGLRTQYRNWYMDLLFGPRAEGSERLHGTSDLAGSGMLSEDVNAGTDVLHECAAAAITAHWDEDTTRQFGMAMLRRDWMQARKGKLRVMPDSLAFDDWTLPYAEFDDAVVTVVKEIVPAYLVRIKSRGNAYQFSVGGSFFGDSYFGGELPFPARRTTVKGFTWSYLAVRLVPLVALLAFFLWSRKK